VNGGTRTTEQIAETIYWRGISKLYFRKYPHKYPRQSNAAPNLGSKFFHIKLNNVKLVII
jgi:hypothetical protein